MSSFVVILTVFTVFNAIRAVISGRTANKHPLSPVQDDGRAKKSLPTTLFTMSKSVDNNWNKYRTFIGKVKDFILLGQGRDDGGGLGELSTVSS